jgi:V/A-type H+-transporting ATPase subunit G/H
MDKEETLHRIKSVEDEVRRAKQDAQGEREKVIRAARRESLDLRDALRAQAEKRAEQILRDADSAIAVEKERTLAEGRGQAAAMKAMAEANLDRAVERLLEKFKGAIHA